MDDEMWLVALDVARAEVVEAARRLVVADGFEQVLHGLQRLRANVNILDKIERTTRA